MAWETGDIPEKWRMAIIIPLDKGKGSTDECRNQKGINLHSVPLKIYGRVLNDMMMETTDRV